MNDNPLSKPTVMEDLTKSNQSTIDDEHNRIEVIDGEDIEFVKLYEKSSIINKNDNNNSDNSDNESEPELRNTSTSNAGESEYESANEEELLFQNNNNNDISNSLTDEQIDEKSNEFIINDYEKNEMSNYYSFVSQKERDDDDDDVVVEEEEELIENIDDANEICENNGSVHDDKHEDMIDNHHQSNNDSNPRECGDGEESIQLENKTVLSDENWNLMNDDSNNNNKDSMINSATTVAPKSLPKSTKLTKAELLKAKRNPQYIPRKGSYFEHDDRGNEEDGTKNNENDQPLNSIGEENEMNDSVDDQKANMATKKKSMFSSMKLCSDEMNDNDHQSMTSQNSDQDQQEGRCLLEKTNNIMESSMTTPSANKKKSIWDSGEKWSHDKFNQEDQRPKTREELINIYGYDIRTETDAPRLNRRSKYGKGPQRYSRRSDDENAYAKKTLRKVIMKSRSSNDHASTSSTSSSINNDHHHMNNNNNLIEKQSSEPNTANKRDRIFDRSLNNDHNSLNNSRNSHQSKSKDMPVTNAKMIKSYRNTGNNSDSNFNSHRYHHQHSDNSSPRIFENDRIFTNKSGGNRSYSNNNNNNMEKTISKTTPSHSNKSSDESGSDIIAQPVTNITPDNSVVGQKDNNNNKQIGKNPMFTNEDFPALMSTSSSSKNNATSASNQSNDDCNNSQESLNKDARNGSKFIYYQLPNSSSESEKSNETKRMTNEDANESVQPATLSESNIGRQAAVQEYNSHYNRQQQQPSSHNAAPVESLQFDNSRYHSSRNNKVTSQTHYYNNSNQSWNNNNPQHRQQSSSKAHHHTYNQNNNTNNTRKYNNNNDESNVLIHHHETNNDDSMTKRYSSLRQQQQRNLNPTAGTGSNVSHHHQPEIDNAAPQYIETDATVKNAIYYESGPATIGVEPAATGNFAVTSTSTGTSLSQQQKQHHHHHHHSHHHGHHNYASPINGSPATSVSVGGPNVVATSVASPATATGFIPTANTLMAYYADPNSGQTTGPPGTATATGPLGLSQTHYYPTDQSQAAANYYLSAATVAFHPSPAAYLPPTATYSPTLAAAATHHPHQSHVTNRFMNTATSATGTAESDRYLQTRPPVTAQNSTPILMTAGGQTGYHTAAAIASAFPSGYPQFPPQPTAATGQQSSTLPAGYPNVQIAANAGSNAVTGISGSGSTPVASTPSGYSESYRGITYYDLQSQQQAMQRIQQQQQQQSNINNNTQSQSTTSSTSSNRRGIGGNNGGGKTNNNESSTNKIHDLDQTNSNIKSMNETKSSSTSNNNNNNNEISVNN